jgi:transforming growth factor-beta-induced protein
VTARARSDSTSRLTVFAPTNEAFAALPAVPTGNALRDVLLYHVLASPEPGIVLSTGLPGSATNLPTQLSGATLPFTPGTPPQVDGQNIVVTDLVATNGVVHVVAGVLTPPG